MNLLSTTLYSGTMFTLTCIVELVSEVDKHVIVHTSWSKDGSLVTNTSHITVNSVAAWNNVSNTFMYVSNIIFNPLSSMDSGGDDGQYKCIAQVMDAEYITGSTTDATQNITVEG